MQVLFGRSASSSRIPHGAWNGWYPPAASSSDSCWMRGSWDTAGHGYGRDRRPFRRVLARVAVDLVQPLRLAVPELEVVVADRPRRREAVHVVQLAEVLGPQPVERGAVELGRPAHEVVHLRLERLAVGVVPGVLGQVLPVDEDLLGVPVVHLPRQEVAPLEDEDALAGRGQRVREGAAAGAAADDDRRRSGQPWSSPRSSASWRSHGPGGPSARCSRSVRVGMPDPGRRRMRSATSPVQPVWWEAPSPAPLSPWKYSLNTT